MNMLKRNSISVRFFLIKEDCFKWFKNLRSKLLFFLSFFVPFFYSSFLFSGSYPGVFNPSELSKKAFQTENQFHAREFSSSLAGNTSECPSLPEIVSAVVYQSVEAPQIEPLAEETNPYNNYDLVANKPAVVLLSLEPPKNFKKDEEYVISLKVNDEKEITEIITDEIKEEKAENEEMAKCSRYLNKIEVTTAKNLNLRLNDRRCKLKGRFFRRNIEKVKEEDKYQKRAKESDIHNLNIFVEIPTKYKGDLRSITKDLSVFISSQGDESCVSNKKDFSVVIRKTSSLYLDFINLTYDPYRYDILSEDFKSFRSVIAENNKSCREDIELSDESVIHQFAGSREVNEYLPMMYPIGEGQVSSSVVAEEFVFGSCNDDYHYNTGLTEGLVSDVRFASVVSELNNIRNFSTNRFKSFYSVDGFSIFDRKLIVIVSEEYMKFHKRPDTAGFILSPFVKHYEPIGSWNVAFVREDTLEDELAKGKDKSQGVVLHEVAHTLGQGKEYYEKEDKNGNPLPPDQQSRCRKFSKDKEIFCHDYKIFGGLMASFRDRSWRFVNDKTSFMDNEPKTIDNLGIDRETFQKLFQTLHHEHLDPTISREQALIQGHQKRGPVVSLSGIYDKRLGVFYDGFSMVYERAFPSVVKTRGRLEALLVKREQSEASNRV